jgi:TonB family protein
MRHLSLKPDARKNRTSFFLLTTLFLLLALSFQTAYAQQPAQLSLADILIGLRSKKVTLPERNQILTGAVVERGITFSLTPEIEKELLNTGADKALVDAIGKKSTVVPAAMVVQPKVEPKPVPAPAPTPDAAFYKKRANSYLAKGEFDLAVVDLNQIYDMKGEDASVYVSRGTAYAGRNRYDLALGDYDKAIELDPKMPAAYLNRGEAHEKSGNTQKAIADYQKVLDLDAANETAKASLLRLQPVQAKVEPKPVVPDPAPPATNNTSANNIPDVLNLGQISSANAKLSMPVYPTAARAMGIQGKVTVQVTLDEEGKVVSAKATVGPSSLRGAAEEAARRSKFNPSKIGDKPVKAAGFVIYNFVN